MKRKLLLAVFFILTFLISGQSAENDKAIAILFDVSLSIKSSDFDFSKRVAISVVDSLKENDEIALYTIGNEPIKIKSFTLDKEGIIQEIQNLNLYSQNTTLFDTIFAASKDLAYSEKKSKIIIIFSDGIDENSTLIFDDVIRELSIYKIPIISVGIGKRIDGKKVLKRLSVLTKGRYYETTAYSEAQLKEIIIQGIDESLKEITQASIKELPKIQIPPTPQIVSKPVEKKLNDTAAFDKKRSNAKSMVPGLWIFGLIAITAGIIVLTAVLILTKEKKTVRKCPQCGQELEPYQIECLNCRYKSEEPFIEPSLLKRTPVTEEEVEHTFVLIEKPVLVVRKGKMIGKKYFLSLDSPTTIGRSANNEIQLDDITVSSQHCRIIPQDKKFYLVDLQSTNGTFLNEKKIKKAEINEGDIIRVGETQLLFKIEQSR